MDLSSIGISNAFTAPCFYSFQHAHAGGLQIHPNVAWCFLDCIILIVYNFFDYSNSPNSRHINNELGSLEASEFRRDIKLFEIVCLILRAESPMSA